MDFVLSNHAKEKIQKRGINEALIFEVLNNPHQIIAQNGKEVYQSIVSINDNKFLLRIFVNTLKKPFIVITAYLTTKISKYWSEK